MEGRLVLRHKVSTSETVQIFCWSDCNDHYASHFRRCPRTFPEVAIFQDVEQGNGYWSSWRDIEYYPIARGHSEVGGEWILCETSMSVRHYTWQKTEQQFLLRRIDYLIWLISFWSIWFVQLWWLIPITWKQGWNNTQMQWLRSTHIDTYQAEFKFTPWMTKELGPCSSESEWLPPGPYVV